MANFDAIFQHRVSIKHVADFVEHPHALAVCFADYDGGGVEMHCCEPDGFGGCHGGFSDLSSAAYHYALVCVAKELDLEW